MTNNNLEKGIPWRFGPDWPGQRCGAKTRKGTALSESRKAARRALSAEWRRIYRP
jgi:hypothetical protein